MAEKAAERIYLVCERHEELPTLLRQSASRLHLSLPQSQETTVDRKNTPLLRSRDMADSAHFSCSFAAKRNRLWECDSCMTLFVSTVAELSELTMMGT